MISVIVPVYNVKDYLEECLDSLVNQTCKDKEIILVDDGSTDGSGRICDSYAEKYKEVRVVHKENGGVSAARNTGIEQASGDSLMFVDADDRIHPQMLQVYEENKNSAWTVISQFSADPSILENAVAASENINVDIEGERFIEYIDVMYSPVNKLYDAEIIKKNGLHFQPEKSLGEDILFNLQYFRYAPPRYRIVEQPLYYYRENRGGSLSTGCRSDLFAVQKEIFRDLGSFLQDMKFWNEQMKVQYYGLCWDRLYLTAKIYAGADNIRKSMLKDILADPVWKDMWKACEDCGSANLKRRIKHMHIQMMKWRSR